jgi:large subunit ribosomal protein L10
MSTVTEQKTLVVEQTVNLLNKYEVIAAANLFKIQSGMLMDLRKSFRGQIEVRAVKNTLMRISMEKAQKKGIPEFIKAIEGQNVFLFSNGNPFKLALQLEKSKVQVFAKAGDKALKEVVVLAGNTGISPGPMISKFSSLGIKTKIESGNIWVIADTPVIQKGEEITSDLADLLQRLGIKAAQMGLSLKAVYENGEIIPGDMLLIDIPSYKKQLETAYSNAFQLVLQTAYVSPETAPSLLAMAFRNAKKVAVEVGYFSPETAIDLIAKANAQAAGLQAKVNAKISA